jgi:hypothetical protein
MKRQHLAGQSTNGVNTLEFVSQHRLTRGIVTSDILWNFRIVDLLEMSLMLFSKSAKGYNIQACMF